MTQSVLNHTRTSQQSPAISSGKKDSFPRISSLEPVGLKEPVTKEPNPTMFK